MNKKRLFSYGLILLLLLLLAGVVWAGPSSGFSVDWSVLSGGGAPATSSNIAADGSLGQTAIGNSTSSSNNISLDAGYWVGARKNEWQLHLPVIMQ